MSIYIFRLSNSENLIGEFLTDDANNFHIDNPMLITERWTGEGRALLLDTYNIYASDTFIAIDKRHVITSFPASDDMVKYYNASLNVNREMNDPSFTESITRAIEYLKQSLEDFREEQKETEEEIAEHEDNNVVDMMKRIRGSNDSLN